jgi:hypothetical protein
MGWYLETPRPREKAAQLVKIHNARIVTCEQAEAFIEDGKKAVICVVQNPAFDAAAFCHSSEEFKHMNYAGDKRPKTWLVIDDREMVENLTGYKEDNDRIDRTASA